MVSYYTSEITIHSRQNLLSPRKFSNIHDDQNANPNKPIELDSLVLPNIYIHLKVLNSIPIGTQTIVRLQKPQTLCKTPYCFNHIVLNTLLHVESSSNEGKFQHLLLPMTPCFSPFPNGDFHILCVSK